MNVIEARYRIVTPMFMAGADQSKAELRAPSIKGALRFWWRALNWSRLFEGSDKSVEETLPLLSQQESELFGDANRVGRSQVQLSLDKVLKGDLSGDSLLYGDNARSYLGYGLFTMGNNHERKAIPEGKLFTLKMLLNVDITDVQKEQLRNAAKLMGLVGGLGARYRNAFGSIAIENIGETDEKFGSREDYRNVVMELLNTNCCQHNDPLFTAIGSNIRFVVGPLKTSSEQAHRYLGRKYKEYRMQHQHDLRKQYFGLPLPAPEYDGENRRASPLFFHVHPIGHQFAPVLLFIPAFFHPDHPDYDYSLIEEFVDQMEAA